MNVLMARVTTIPGLIQGQMGKKSTGFLAEISADSDVWTLFLQKLQPRTSLSRAASYKVSHIFLINSLEIFEPYSCFEVFNAVNAFLQIRSNISGLLGAFVISRAVTDPTFNPLTSTDGSGLLNFKNWLQRTNAVKMTGLKVEGKFFTFFLI